MCWNEQTARRRGSGSIWIETGGAGERGCSVPQRTEAVDQTLDIGADIQEVGVPQTPSAESDTEDEVGLHAHLTLYRIRDQQRIDVCAVGYYRESPWGEEDLDVELTRHGEGFDLGRSDEGCMDEPVLVGVRERVEQSQRMGLRVGSRPTHIRLFGVHECPVVIADATEGPFSVAWPPGRTRIDVFRLTLGDGKAGAGRSFPIPVQEGKLIDEVIEAAPEIVCEVSGQNAELQRWLFPDVEDAIDPDPSPLVTASYLRGIVRLSLDEQADLFVERLTVFEGAINLRLHAVEGMAHP